MKKIWASFLTIILVCSMSIPAFAADEGIRIFVNNEKVSFDVPPQTINGRTMVPMRAIFESLGAEVIYDAEERMIRAKKEDSVLVLPLQEKTAGLYDADTNTFIKSVGLDTPAVIRNGRTLVPIRAISDSFGYDVKWNQQTKTVSVLSAGISDATRFDGYTMLTVDGGDLSGSRVPNAVVDIGYGDREYWAFTNAYGQLVRVVADEIIPQDEQREPVLSTGRYYRDEAKVPGVERADLDEGHVIADSLGGVSNAYNITPQDSTLNRYGDQAYMEKSIRSAGGAANFEAIITYPHTGTQIPSHYQYTYTINGNVVVDSFDNVNPDKVNAEMGLTGSKPETGAVSATTEKGNMVWIPKSGTKYHSRPGCSNMQDPTEVTISAAISKGYTACKRCY